MKFSPNFDQLMNQNAAQPIREPHINEAAWFGKRQNKHSHGTEPEYLVK